MGVNRTMIVRDKQNHTASDSKALDRMFQALDGLEAEGADDGALAEMLSQFKTDPGALGEQELESLREIEQMTEIVGGDNDLAELFRRDAQLAVELSADGMCAIATAQPAIAGGSELTFAQVETALKDAAVNAGVDPPTVQQFVDRVNNGEALENWMLAEGQSPTGEPGENTLYGRSQSDADLEPLRPADLQSDGHLFCRKGDVIAEHRPATQEELGFNVRGEARVTPVEPLACGDNVHVEQRRIIADCDGIIELQDGRLGVARVLVHNGDVTARNETLTFDGDIVINGSVRSRASVAASGSITVSGTVEGAQLVAGGSITLQGGLVGHGYAQLRAGMDVQARFAENARIHADRDVTLSVGALRSRVYAGRNLSVTKGRGRFACGTAVVGHRMQVRCLGARGADRTRVILGLSPETIRAIEKVDEAIAGQQRLIDRAAEITGQVCRVLGDPKNLPTDRLKQFVTLKKAALAAKLKGEQLTEQRDAITGDDDATKAARLEIVDLLHADVTIQIGDATMHNDRLRRACMVFYSPKEQRIIVGRPR